MRYRIKIIPLKKLIVKLKSERDPSIKYIKIRHPIISFSDLSILSLFSDNSFNLDSMSIMHGLQSSKLNLFKILLKIYLS